jgi:hypothetical protein
MSEIEIVERDARGRFLTGGKAGPGRRPGSRNRHSENFLAAFANDFEQHGTAVIEQVRRQSPEVWLKLAGDLLPRETAQKMEGAGEHSVFRSCETIDQIFDVLFDDLGDSPDDILGFLDEVRSKLLARCADRARPVESVDG